ncbi:MAG: quinone-dependent dihydroorotate dehydrogenase [Patescibacteria group bacterium]|nr:quinone-dependent dihydroorotate dehydrogenase [Patescibacteria group bacterium]
MYETWISARNAFFHFSYTKILKPFYFRLDPEFIHDRMTKVGKILGRFGVTRALTSAAFDYRNAKLEQTILGIKFANPLGLAAGFDKNAEIIDILPSVGFGFTEVGSITGEPCPGNPKKRLWRLPKSKSLVVYYGLKNDGCEALARRLKDKNFPLPVGVSVAKTNNQACADAETGIADYAKAFETMKDIGQYITVNISCPNAFGGEPFTDPQKLETLLTRLDAIQTDKPIFLKLAADLSHAETDAIIDVVRRHRVHGFVCTNLTKRRDNPKIIDAEVPKVGGLSGKVVQEMSDELIRYVYSKTKDTHVVIGCGGVFTAQDAYRKIRLGSSLIQLITGMIYEGPQQIGAINQGLVKLLEKDGFNNISEAIGVDNR